jgi:hypothetical protein
MDDFLDTQSIYLSLLSSEPKTAWSQGKPSFCRSFKALIKKSFLLKLRHKASIIEFIVSILLVLIILPIYYVSKATEAEIKDPNIALNEGGSKEFMSFLLSSGNVIAAYTPDNNESSSFFNFAFQNLSLLNVSINHEKDLNSMTDLIYSQNFNGFGVRWANSNEPLNNSLFELYSQSYTSSPTEFTYNTLFLSAASKLNLTNITAANISHQVYPQPSSQTYDDISILLSMLGFYPIIFSTMPEIQLILEEKDSKVFALSLLMGCPESAYWLISFLVPFILSLPSYVIFSFLLCFEVSFVGSDVSLF